MQNTGSSTAHNRDVKRKNDNRIPSSAGSNHCVSTSTVAHRKHERFSSECDISSIQIQLRNKLNRNRNDVHSGYVKRKDRWNCTPSTSLLLVVISVIVNFELVFGALPLNYNSVNHFDNSSYALADDRDIALAFDDASVHNQLDDRPSSRQPVVYQNEFAVFIPGGVDRADKIAEKYGFTNMGQVRTSPL